MSDSKAELSLPKQEQTISRRKVIAAMGGTLVGIAVGGKFLVDILKKFVHPTSEQVKAKEFFEQASPEDFIKVIARGERTGENDVVIYRNRPQTPIDDQDHSVKLLGSLKSGQEVEAVVVSGRSRVDPGESARWLVFKNPNVSDKINEYVFALAELFDDPSGRINKVQPRDVRSVAKPVK